MTGATPANYDPNFTGPVDSREPFEFPNIETRAAARRLLHACHVTPRSCLRKKLRVAFHGLE